MSCIRCNTDIHIKTIEGKFGPHTLKVICTKCNKFIKWGSHKTEEEKEESKKHFRKLWYNQNVYDKPIYD